MPSRSITVRDRKSQLMEQTSLLSNLKELPQPPEPLATITVINQQTSRLRKEPPPAKRVVKAQMMGKHKYAHCFRHNVFAALV